MPPTYVYTSTAVVGVISATFGIPAAAGALGFTSKGILAGSTAAFWLSLGKGTTPAAVSVMQSIGATGAFSGATKAASGAVAAAATWAFSGGKK